MKHFACGDVVPGCAAAFSAPSVDELLTEISLHAGQDHEMTDINPAIIAAITAHITDSA